MVTLSKLLVFVCLFTINIQFTFILSIKIIERLAKIRKYHTYDLNGQDKFMFRNEVILIFFIKL